MKMLDFLTTLTVLWTLVFLQFGTAFLNNRCFLWQLEKHRIFNSWAASEHLGLWADIPMSVLVSYVISSYQFYPFSLGGLVCWGLVIGITVGGTRYYLHNGVMTADNGDQNIGIIHLDLNRREGRLFLTGVIHIIFTIPVMWVIFQVYLGQTVPHVSHRDLLLGSACLTPLLILGIMKWSPLWMWDKTSRRQRRVTLLILWAATAVNLLFY